MKSVLIALSVAFLAAATGCNTTRTVQERDAGSMKLSVWQSAKKVNVNETVTFEATDSNTLGRNAKIAWETSNGKLWTTDTTQRVAQVTFDTPGTHIVTATITADNQQPLRETRTVDVLPIRP